ncbi:hypothetical protein QTG54_004842 [Skeletonema marinoi]|uniref:Signal sequence receptor subunit alpha n=1 Tax=Skeletonema marinoi TaxID=267567 RepID=A0AAD8YD74_9STRA|nr:hypothetical protein QTG54_004842 [Skeletonema marinoi]
MDSTMKRHKLILSIALFALCLPLSVQSYRIGDAVGIIIRTNKHKLEAYRHQMPRFGVSTKTKIETQFLIDAAGNDLKLADGIRLARQKQNPHHHNYEDNTQEELLRMSMQFDEGFHHISTIDVYNPSQRPPRKALDTLIIKFVYSASDGSIHSVQQQTRYRDFQPNGGGRNTMPKSFTVEYVWIEEADVDLESGVLFLFAIVLLVALLGMMDVCCGSEIEENGGTYSTARKAPKSADDFAKRL